VSDNAPDNNYGGDFLYVGRMGNLPVRSFLKFDLSVIPGGSTIENASLNLTTRVFDGTAGGVFGGGENVQCHPVDNDNWSQGTITWNNAPWTSIGNILDAKSVTRDFTLYSWEVTNFVAGEFGGNNEVSFSMIGAGENTAPDHWARFYSKESGPSVSYLSISYAPGPHSMVVSISPNQIIGRDNVSYSVTVQNVGFMPTYITQQAIKITAVQPVKVRIDVGTDSEVVSGRERVLIGNLEGNSERLPGYPAYSVPGGKPEESKKTVEWILKAKKRPAKAKITCMSEKAGTDSREIVLA
jgi:hypothetical protein